ncbi:hypothetical protein WJ69_23065 [Burkholderia ubonensis]|uniref:hypothetical protein n=1 Tax=Burkholderia ubonensis TaxID=101571 RepID=UPI00075A28E2|nr:hypothetical protein [Burkholderia ubonensis]KVO05583.1 hypothetical protein WJ69_23065 [Burkholderia ubonensis]
MNDEKFEQRAMTCVDEGAARQFHMQPVATPELRNAPSDLPAVGTRPPPRHLVDLRDDELPY